jgi:hypothetical protein
LGLKKSKTFKNHVGGKKRKPIGILPQRHKHKPRGRVRWIIVAGVLIGVPVKIDVGLIISDIL